MGIPCPAPLMSPLYTGCRVGVPVPGPTDVPPCPQSSAALWGGAGGRSLQRVAAVAFPSAQELEQWERAQDEAAQRDHRRIGKVSPAGGRGVPHSHRAPW